MGGRKPKEITAVCFPGGGAGRTNPLLISPHAGQAERRLENLAKTSEPSCGRGAPGPEPGSPAVGPPPRGRCPWAVAFRGAGAGRPAVPPSPHFYFCNKNAQCRAARGSSLGKREAPGNSWSLRKEKYASQGADTLLLPLSWKRSRSSSLLLVLNPLHSL